METNLHDSPCSWALDSAPKPGRLNSPVACPHLSVQPLHLARTFLKRILLATANESFATAHTREGLGRMTCHMSLGIVFGLCILVKRTQACTRPVDPVAVSDKLDATGVSVRMVNRDPAKRCSVVLLEGLFIKSCAVAATPAALIIVFPFGKLLSFASRAAALTASQTNQSRPSCCVAICEPGFLQLPVGAQRTGSQSGGPFPAHFASGGRKAHWKRRLVGAEALPRQ